jgi:acyl-CoA thioester hydrolase
MWTPARVSSVDIEVRHYELDAQGHVNSAVYLMYGEHARCRHFESLGIGLGALAGVDMGLVLLELTIKYLRELRAGDAVTVSCELVFPDADGKTFLFDHHLHRVDGVPVADIRCTAGLLNLSSRRLVKNPRAAMASLANTDAFSS